MNVYDFDKTIYDGDSTVDFYKYCLKNYPVIYKKIPEVVLFGVLFKLGITKKKDFKSRFFKFATLIPNLEEAVADFWSINKNKIKKFYINTQRDDDILISASPTFILDEICKILNIKHLYATNVDLKTGKIIGENCYGEEKVRRFYEAGHNKDSIDKFYSDSLSDSPLAEISKEAFIVKKENLIPWKEYKKYPTA